MNYKIISVGGSIVVPTGGFDIAFLKNFRDLIKERTETGEKFILTIGGGSTCRLYQQALRDLGGTDESLDILGIASTVLNAEFIRLFFGDLAHKKVLQNPKKKIITDQPVIIAAGWKVGCSTDKDAVLWSKTYGAKEIVNLSNIDFVYDADPRINPEAKKIERGSWKEFRKVIGKKWQPGANLPFDPVAARLAERNNLKVKFVLGTDLERVKKALKSEEFIGTIISCV